MVYIQNGWTYRSYETNGWYWTYWNPDVDDTVEFLLKPRLDVQKRISYPIDTLPLFAENAFVDAQNKFLINLLNTEFIFIKAIDNFFIN